MWKWMTDSIKWKPIKNLIYETIDLLKTSNRRYCCCYFSVRVFGRVPFFTPHCFYCTCNGKGLHLFFYFLHKRDVREVTAQCCPDSVLNRSHNAENNNTLRSIQCFSSSDTKLFMCVCIVDLLHESHLRCYCLSWIFHTVSVGACL